MNVESSIPLTTQEEHTGPAAPLQGRAAGSSDLIARSNQFKVSVTQRYTEAEADLSLEEVQGGPNTDSLRAATTIARHSQLMRDYGRSSEPRNEAVEPIVRTHFMSQILRELKGIQNEAGTPGAAAYAGRMIRVIRAWRDTSRSDPFLGVLISFHDALAYEQAWSNYTASQYAEAYQLLRRLSDEQWPDRGKVDRGIAELERIGFRTLPFLFVAELDDGEEAEPE